MLQWHLKFLAQCKGILYLIFHSITDCAQSSKKVEMLTKSFWISDNRSSIDSLVYTKRRWSLSSQKEILWKPSIWLCIQTSTWIRKWTVRKVDFEHMLLNKKSLCKAGLWYLSDIVVPKILANTHCCGWNKSFGVNKLNINVWRLEGMSRIEV